MNVWKVYVKKLSDELRTQKDCDIVVLSIHADQDDAYQSEITKQKSTHPYGTIINIDKKGIYVSTKDFVIKLIDIKLEGKKRCLVKDFVNGIKLEEYVGKVLK